MFSANASIMLDCIQLAKQQSGFTKTNPLVGAAVVNSGNVISFGVHERYGEPHAEINALASAGDKANGAELYVTLEPCSSYGKTPPCSEAIIKAGIKKVYIGILDPNHINRHKGVEALRNAGIKVEVGVALEESALLIEDFTKSILDKRPYVTMKVAMSLDGKIATKTRDSKWITGVKSREMVHTMRARAGAVITGIGTVLVDDPMLNSRADGVNRQPLRVVLDTYCKLSMDSKLVQTANELPLKLYTSELADKKRIAQLQDCGVDVKQVQMKNAHIDLSCVLDDLYTSDKVMNVMIEGGAGICGSFIDDRLVDRLNCFIAPKIIGSESALSPIGGDGAMLMSEAINTLSMSVSKVGDDVYIDAILKRYTDEIVRETVLLRQGR